MTKLRAALIALTAALVGSFPISVSAQSPSFYSVAPSYYWGYSYYPYAAALHAEGDYLIQVQRAKIVSQEAAQKKLETHRKELEHYAWTRNFDHEEWKKQRERKFEANRLESYDQNISTGQLVRALNLLLDDLSRQADLKSVQPVEIDSSILRHISFSLVHGNIGFLKQLEHLPWPLVLMDKAYAEDREQVKKLMEDALKITMKGEMAVEHIMKPNNYSERSIRPSAFSGNRRKRIFCSPIARREKTSSSWSMRWPVEGCISPISPRARSRIIRRCTASWSNSRSRSTATSNVKEWLILGAPRNCHGK
jgi:hypothetical protein